MMHPYAGSSRGVLALAAVLVFGVALTQSAAAQPGIDGTFHYDASSSDDVAEAIDTAIAGLNFLHRRFARSHLLRDNEPYRTVTIGQDEESIWIAADGEVMRERIVRDNGAIRQTIMREDEERENLFSLDPDGRTLFMTVTVRRELLPEPIRYRLVYRRADDDHAPRGGGVGNLSIELGGGLVVIASEAIPPYFGGLTTAYRIRDWLLIDTSATYWFGGDDNNGDRFHFLAGPRFRSAGIGLAVGGFGLDVGMQAGAVNLPEAGIRFGLSPRVNLEATLHGILVGLGFIASIPIGGGEAGGGLYKSIGFRFSP